jgi:dodecin
LTDESIERPRLQRNRDQPTLRARWGHSYTVVAQCLSLQSPNLRRGRLEIVRVGQRCGCQVAATGHPKEDPLIGCFEYWYALMPKDFLSMYPGRFLPLLVGSFLSAAVAQVLVKQAADSEQRSEPGQRAQGRGEQVGVKRCQRHATHSLGELGIEKRCLEAFYYRRARNFAAIRNGLSRAAQTTRGLDWFEVQSVRGHLENGVVAHFQVTLKVGFRLEEA